MKRICELEILINRREGEMLKNTNILNKIRRWEMKRRIKWNEIGKRRESLDNLNNRLVENTQTIRKEGKNAFLIKLSYKRKSEKYTMVRNNKLKWSSVSPQGEYLSMIIYICLPPPVPPQLDTRK